MGGVTRATSALLVVITIALGGASRVWPIGFAAWDKSLGDVAYAIMIAFLLSFVFPRARSLAIGGSAMGLCFVLEAFQATGIPARAPRLLRIVLGTTFAWHDLACYAVGGVVAALVHARITRPKNANG
jgi:hypothetical protein